MGFRGAKVSTVGFGAAAHVGDGAGLREEGNDVILGCAEGQVLDVHRLALVLDHVRPAQARRRVAALGALVLLPPPRLRARPTTPYYWYIKLAKSPITNLRPAELAEQSPASACLFKEPETGR